MGSIGLSGGAITLLHMATAEPSSIESMVIVSAPPYFPAEARLIMRQFSESVVSEAEMARMRKRHARAADPSALRHGSRFCR